MNVTLLGTGEEIPPLQIFGPRGTQEFVDRLFGPEGAFSRDLVSRTRHPLSEAIYRARGGTPPRPWPDTAVTELEGTGILEGGGWRILRREVPHFQPHLESFGFRVESGGGAFAYSSDVNLALVDPSPALVALAQDADVLVHYLNAFPFDIEGRSGFNGASLVARTARDARVKTLVTSHHGPYVDSGPVRGRLIAEIHAIYQGKIVWGEDLMRFEI